MATRKRPPLTPVREAWAKQRNGAIFRGTPLNVPAAAEARFAAALNAMTDAMVRTTIREITQLYNSEPAQVHAIKLGTVAMDAPSFTTMAQRLVKRMRERFTALFTEKAGGLAAALAKGVERSTAKSLGDSLKTVSGGVTLKTDVVSGVVGDVVKASVKQNVALIKSIPAKHFNDIEGAVMRSIQTGRGMADLQPEIEKIGSVSKERAGLIARDQTSKATTAINRARMAGLGIKKFEWLHSYGGKHPRLLHKDVLNGKIFSLDDPPVIDERTGEKGLPGQLINCRCRMVPVISFESEETTNDE